MRSSLFKGIEETEWMVEERLGGGGGGGEERSRIRALGETFLLGIGNDICIRVIVLFHLNVLSDEIGFL